MEEKLCKENPRIYTACFRLLRGMAEWRIGYGQAERGLAGIWRRKIGGIKMKISEIKFSDNWQEVKDSCMTTINKSSGKYPDSTWKKKILLCEHSPVRRLRFYWKWEDLKYWTSVHFARHKIGIEHWVGTQRTKVERDAARQDALVNHSCEANAQALINISRKRLCSRAAKETRNAWEAVKVEIAKKEPELAECMVRECIYRGFCPELHTCGYCRTDEYKKELEKYRKV